MADEGEKKKEGEQGGGDAPQEDTSKQADVKTSHSFAKRKFMSRSIIASKSSLKKLNESMMSNILLATSSNSLAMKRQSDFERLAKGPKYQPTYRLDSKKPFKAHEVYKLLEMIVEREVTTLPVYDAASGPKLVQTISAEVRSSVKALSYDRYKICVLCYLGEKKLQGFQAVFRALWDSERDSWTTYEYQCRTYFLICICYGVYHD